MLDVLHTDGFLRGRICSALVSEHDYQKKLGRFGFSGAEDVRCAAESAAQGIIADPDRAVRIEGTLRNVMSPQMSAAMQFERSLGSHPQQ